MKTAIVILLIYFALMIVIARYFSKRESLQGYFLNNRNTGIWLMTFSTVATIIGAGATIVPVSEIYNSGISYGVALLLSLIAGVIIMGLLAEKIKGINERFNAYTLVDFFAVRFDRKNKVLVQWLQVSLLVLWTGIQAIGITALASVLLSVDYQVALLLAALVTIAYTAIGGLKVDIITDFIQFFVMIIVFFLMAVIGYFKVGGFSGLFSNLPSSFLNPFAFNGLGWMVGLILVGGFIYLGNASHWQRIFSAKNSETARKSFFLSIPFMIIMSFTIIFLGLVAAALFSGIQKETAIFRLIDVLLSPALAGFGFAAILATVMSSIDSYLIAGSTIAYKAFFVDSESKHQVIIARTITAIFGVVAFLFALLIPDIIKLGLFVTYLALIFVPAMIAGLYSDSISSNASFYSILLPTIFLLIFYPFVGANTFLITSPLSILIVLFWDKFSKK